MSEYIPLICACLSVFLLVVGIRSGNKAQRSYDADQAISENPSREWQEALIDAKARVEKKGLSHE